MPRPTFLVIGAQKAATTTLYRWLREHPDVFLPDLKETNFLLDVGTWGRGLDWYESLYADGEATAHRGDVSPAYTMSPLFRHAPERARDVLPEAKLVYLVRHPVERMVSAWAQLVGVGFEHRDLADALLHEAHYAQTSMYGMQAAQWLAHFDRDALLILRAEDLTSDPGPSLDRLLDHLALPTGWRPDDVDRAWNRTADKRISPAPLRRLGGALRRQGWGRAADALGPGGRVGRRFARPLPRPRLDSGLADSLLATFHPDACHLRDLVGPDMDLWGLA